MGKIREMEKARATSAEVDAKRQEAESQREAVDALRQVSRRKHRSDLQDASRKAKKHAASVRSVSCSLLAAFGSIFDTTMIL